jgi:hypothetical protein
MENESFWIMILAITRRAVNGERLANDRSASSQGPHNAIQSIVPVRTLYMV